MELGLVLHVLLFATSGALCLALIRLAARVPRLSGSPGLLRSVQAFHLNPTPRVGGIAIFAALTLGILLMPDAILNTYISFIFSAGVLFIVGLSEDLGFGVSPLRRLLVALFASLLVVMFLGISMPRMGIPALDWLMSYWAISVALTLLVTAGIANAFNLIDGVNGLASIAAMTAAAAMGAIAHHAGHSEISTVALFLISAIMGFFVFNFPFGRIFLGDAGAYTLGFVLAWLAVALMVKVPEVSPWALLLTLFWPVADTLLAIYRRWLKQCDRMAPDRLHVHQLVLRALEIYVLGRGNRRVANPLTTLFLTPLIIAPAVLGVIFWNDVLGSFISVLVCAMVFFGAYVLAFPMLRRARRKAFDTYSPDYRVDLG